MTERNSKRRILDKKIEEAIKNHSYTEIIDALLASLTASSVLFVKAVDREVKQKALGFIQKGLQAYLHIFHDELSKEVDRKTLGFFSYEVIGRELERMFDLPPRWACLFTGYLLLHLTQILNIIGEPRIKKFEDVIALLEDYLNGDFREAWRLAVKAIAPNVKLPVRGKPYVS